MKRFEWSSLDAAGRKDALARPKRRSQASVGDIVRAIFDVGSPGTELEFAL